MDGKAVELDLEAHTNPGDEYGLIKYGGTVIASIRQTDIHFRKGQQEITLAANVDKVLTVSLVICMDIRYNEREHERVLSDERRRFGRVIEEELNHS